MRTDRGEIGGGVRGAGRGRTGASTTGTSKPRTKAPSSKAKKAIKAKENLPLQRTVRMLETGKSAKNWKPETAGKKRSNQMLEIVGEAAGTPAWKSVSYKGKAATNNKTLAKFAKKATADEGEFTKQGLNRLASKSTKENKQINKDVAAQSKKAGIKKAYVGKEVNKWSYGKFTREGDYESANATPTVPRKRVSSTKRSGKK